MTRNKEIDIMRGLAIILMVIGHSGFIYKDYIYLFHMAVFFMISGYLYSPKYSKDLKSVWTLIKKRIVSLWLPCFVWTSVFILLNNFFIKINVYTDDSEFAVLTPSAHKELMHYMSAKEMLIGIVKSFFFLGDSQLGGVFWFFNTLFFITVLFCMIDFILNNAVKKEIIRILVHITISIILLIIGYLEITPVNLFNRLLSCYCLIVFGYIIKLKMSALLKLKICYYFISFIVAFVALFIMYRMGHISLNVNTYENPAFLLIASLLGWVLMFSLCKMLTAFKALKYLNYLVEILGKHTVSIAALHFLAFKLVSLVEVILYDKPMILIASYPVCYSNHGWWIIYTIVGLGLPCLLEMIYEKSKTGICSKLAAKTS